MNIYFNLNAYENTKDCRISIHKEGYDQKIYFERYRSKILKEEFGYIELVHYDDKYMEISTVYVIDHMRGRGHGRCLYNQALEYCKTNGYSGLISKEIWRNKKSNWIWQGTPLIKIAGENWNFMS